MIRIHFTAADLGRVTFPAEPSPLWEAALAARALGDRAIPPVARRWRRDAGRRLRPSMRPLFKLIAPAGQFPDFLTPDVRGLEPAVETLMDTPTEVIREELDPWLPADVEPFMRGLLAGTPASRRALGVAVLDFHQQVLVPSSAELDRRYGADLALRSHTLLHGGVEALLAALHPDVEWSTPVLTTHGLHPRPDSRYPPGRPRSAALPLTAGRRVPGPGQPEPPAGPPRLSVHRPPGRRPRHQRRPRRSPRPDARRSSPLAAGPRKHHSAGPASEHLPSVHLGPHENPPGRRPDHHPPQPRQHPALPHPSRSPTADREWRMAKPPEQGGSGGFSGLG